MKIWLPNERFGGTPSPGEFLVEHDDGFHTVTVTITGEGGHPVQRVIPLNEWKRMCASFALAKGSR